MANLSSPPTKVSATPIILERDTTYALCSIPSPSYLTSCFGKPFESAPVGDDMVHSFIILKNFVDSYHDRNSGKLLHLEICETNNA
jgi:hypothetical protein